MSLNKNIYENPQSVPKEGISETNQIFENADFNDEDSSLQKEIDEIKTLKNSKIDPPIAFNRKNIFDQTQEVSIYFSNNNEILDETQSYLYKEITQLNEIIEKLEYEEKALLSENKSLKERKEGLEKSIHSNELPPPIENTFFDRTHDIILNIDSLKEVNWKIECFMPPEKKAFFFQGKKENIVIGVLGKKKVGKSYLLGKLTNLPLPEGYDDETKGLSIKYSTKDNLSTVCLDSAGINSPVLYNDDKLIEKLKCLLVNGKDSLRMTMINDKKLTEAFIEDFILSVSKVVIVVVGIFSREDQIIIERVRSLYTPGKKIIIIHNFSYISTEDYLQNRIEKDIKLAFNVKEEIIPKSNLKFYREEIEDRSKNKNKYEIWHFVYAQEKTPIGQKYNQVALEYIWRVIKDNDERVNFEIVDQLKGFFSLNYSKYYKTPENGQNEMSLYESDGHIRLKTILKEIHTREPIFSALGSMVKGGKNMDFEPPYQIIEERDGIYNFQMEVTNMLKDSFSVQITREMAQGDINYSRSLLEIKGEKVHEPTSKTNNQLFSNRQFGKFKILIEIGSAIDVYKIIKQEILIEIGLIKIQYERQKKTKTKIVFR